MSLKRDRSTDGSTHDREPKRQPQPYWDGGPSWIKPPGSTTPEREVEEGDYGRYRIRIANIHGPDYQIPLDYTRNAHLRSESDSPSPLGTQGRTNAGASARSGAFFGEISNRPWEDAFPGAPGLGRPHQPKASDPPLEPDVDPPTLKGTSQGPKTCAPPEHWIKEELIKFGALRTPGIYIMDLEESQYLDSTRFIMADSRRAALSQSIALIGLLLETSAAYFANMFPRRPNFYYMDDAPDKQRVVMSETLDKRERVFTFEYLMAFINTHVTFLENKKLYSRRSRLAVTHPSYTRIKDVPLDSSGFDNLMTEEWHKAANRGIQRKDWYHHITITFTTDFVDVILASKEGSEERLIATVSAATVLVHHIAYAARLAHVKGHRNEKFKRWVGLDVEFDDGYALEGWLFGGWYPSRTWFHGLHSETVQPGFAWRKWHRIPCHEPAVEVQYSVSLAHVQRWMRRAEWSRYQVLVHWSDGVHAEIIENLLAPKTPFRLGRCARIGWYPVPWKLDKTKAGFIPNPWLYSTQEGPCPFVDLDWDDDDDTDPPVNPATFAKSMAGSSTPKKRLNPSAPPKPNFLKRLLATKTAKTRTGKNVEPYSDWWYEGGIKKPDITKKQKVGQRTASGDEGNEKDEEHAMATAADDDGAPFLPRDTEDEDEDPLFPEPSDWDAQN
ncbi:hypothetical protein MMC17_004223 [Xylographa soralifera]|nr:hypothetical protein [Xylographa soralifera]